MLNRKTRRSRTALWKAVTSWLLIAGVVFVLAGCEEGDAIRVPVGVDTATGSPDNELGARVRGTAAVETPSPASPQDAPLTPSNDSPIHDESSIQHDDTPPTSPTETTVLHNHYAPLHYNAAARPLQERILKSQVIVRVRLLSAETPDIHRMIMAGNPLPPQPILTTYRFKALEYLKGTGPAEFEVQGNTSKGNNDWDDREALLFLTTQEEVPASSASASQGNVSPSQTFVFASVHEDHPDEYAIGSLNPVWLPAAVIGPAAAADSQPASVSAETTYATDWEFTHSRYEMYQKMKTMTATEVWDAIRYQGSVLDLDAGQPAGFMTLKEIKDTIAWVVGNGTPEYNYCVERAINYLKHYRDVAAYYGEPWTPGQSEEDITSGSPGGSVIIDYGTIRERGYPKDFLSGEHAQLFRGEIGDDDNDPLNGFKYQISNRRPLPARSYTFTDHGRPHEFAACNFAPVNYQLDWTVTVEAPVGTVHEAFFDPVAIGQGVGANATHGVLKPTGFTLEGSATEIKSLVWQDNRVTMTLSPYVSLLGQTLDFITLDGTTALSLKVKSATVNDQAGTLTWDQTTQPWSAGDQLMLRLHGPVVSIEDASAPEDASDLEFRVTLSKASDEDIKVKWTTMASQSLDPRARGGSGGLHDYWMMSGEILIRAGDTSGTGAVWLNQDSEDEADEVFTVLIFSPVGATIGRSEATMTIIDDD